MDLERFRRHLDRRSRLHIASLGLDRRFLLRSGSLNRWNKHGKPQKTRTTDPFHRVSPAWALVIKAYPDTIGHDDDPGKRQSWEKDMPRDTMSERKQEYQPGGVISTSASSTSDRGE